MNNVSDTNSVKQFGILAEYYDLLNHGVNYKKIADYTESIFEIYNIKPEIILDLACGTGNLTIELDKREYDMIGLDLSYEMLSAASRKKRHKTAKGNILWINQDMTNFELYGTVDAVICAFDSLNYILNNDDLFRCFKLVYNYLNYGGVFIFDVNSRYKFEQVYGRNNFLLEGRSKGNNVFCAWRNHYDKRTKICDFDMTLFVEHNGQYQRYDELQREKYHSQKFLIELLNTLDFADIKIFHDFDINLFGDNSDNKKRERICFSCVKKLL